MTTQTFGPTKSNPVATASFRTAFADMYRGFIELTHNGMALLELPYLWGLPTKQGAASCTEISGWDVVEQAQARGKGIIFLTPHMGSFESTAQVFSTRAPITVLYRPNRKLEIQQIIEDSRARDNVKLAPTNLGGVKILLKALKRGEAVGMLPDQVPGFGEGALKGADGKLHGLHKAADFSLYGAANVAYLGEPVPPIGPEDLAWSGVERILPVLNATLSAEEAGRAAYLFARGGRFEPAAKGRDEAGQPSKRWPKPLMVWNPEVGSRRHSQSGLFLSGEVLVDDADAALLRDGDGQARLGHGVHGGGHERQVQLDIAGEFRREGRVLGQDLGVRWHQQHIVEGERFSKKAHEKAPKDGLYPRRVW